MSFKDFRVRVLLKLLFLSLTIGLIIYMAGKDNMLFAAILLTLVIGAQLYDLFSFVSQTNRKLTRFLESIKYSDFISGFAADNNLGKSFRNLNKEFNEVLETFRKTRSEREEHWQYLNTVVQQVRTGIISYDSEGQIQLINTNAKRFLDMPNMHRIDELAVKNHELYEAITLAKPGEGSLYRGKNDLHLTIQCTVLRIRGNHVNLITLQNIQTELQKQELEAWQNLTRVLRHEIMNSITPISSLTSTLKDVLEYELKRNNSDYSLQEEVVDDLREGLRTIENRSKALITFIDAYREYTSLPRAKIRTVRLKDLIEKVSTFMKTELRNNAICFELIMPSEYLTIQADAELIEQVLINLIKNAKEALIDTSDPSITLAALYDMGRVTIEVRDNGPGIIPEAINSIFIPFYTTKKSGSGIGLSLSKQVMQMHQGGITVQSEPGCTVFTLHF